MSLLSIIGWDVIGWENLTPQGIRFGIATILALLAVGPPGDVSPRALCRSNLHPGCGPHGDASGLAGPLTAIQIEGRPLAGLFSLGGIHEILCVARAGGITYFHPR